MKKCWCCVSATVGVDLCLRAIVDLGMTHIVLSSQLASVSTRAEHSLISLAIPESFNGRNDLVGDQE
jgi:hypothetical protein